MIKRLKKKYKKNNECIIKECIYAEEFVNVWNSLSNEKMEDLFLYIHGGKQKLCFKNSYIYHTVKSKENKKKPKKERDYQFSNLKSINNIFGKIYLNSCHGGTGESSVAATLSKKAPGRSVRAVVNGNVYYRSWSRLIMNGEPLTKEKGAYWCDLTYRYSHRDKKYEVFITDNRENWVYG